MFELNFKDERYLPFEGAGVISSWQLELPEVRQFDYETITDVVVHVRYTSCQGSDSLKKAAARATRDYLNGMNELGREQGMFSLIDLKNDMPNQWHQVMRSTDRTSPGRFDLSTLADFLPYFVRINESNRLDSKRIKINNMWLIHQSELTAEDLSIIDSNQNSPNFEAGSTIGDAEVLGIPESELSLSGLSLIINDVEKAKTASRMYLIVHYKLSE